MSTIRKATRNTCFILLSRVITKVISFFILMYIARYLGPTDYGKFSFSFAFVYFFSFIPDLGVHNILVRESAKDPENSGKIIGNATIVKIFLSFLALSLAFSVIYIIDYPASTKIALYIASLGLLADSISAFGIIYETKLRMEYSVLFSVSSRIFFLIFVMLAIAKNLTLTTFVFVSVASDFVHNLLMLFFSKKFVKVKFDFDFSIAKNILVEALPIALASVFSLIYYRVDVMMLSFMKDDIAVGIYSASYRITEALTFIPAAYMTSAFPLMSRYFRDSHEKFSRIYIKSFKYLFTTGLMLAILIIFNSDYIIIHMYGQEYQNSIVVLKILMGATTIMFVNNLICFTYVASGNQHVIAKITAVAALLNVILNLVLIPSNSFVGASIATFSTELLLMIFGIFWIKRNLISETLFYEIASPLVGAFVTSILLFSLKPYLGTIASSLLSVASFTGILLLLRWFGSEEKELIMKIVNAKKYNMKEERG